MTATRLNMVNESVLDLIGNTPMVDVSVLSPKPSVRLVAKLENQNPFGSVKDRIAKAMIEAAEKDGRLQPGQRILEPSSGNTGIALAAIAQIKGYPITILMPTSVSVERRQMLQIFGADIVLTPGEEGSNGAVRRAQEMAEKHPEWCFLYQYGNDANPRAHYETTGPEVLRDCPEITHFVAGLGTSGTLMGTGRYLREHKPEVKIIAIEPPLGERVEGLRNLEDGYIPPVFENWNGFELLDRKRVVRPRESIEWTRRLVAQTGIFAGLSSGASLAGAIKVANEIDEGTVVFIVCDGGWKYLSTGAYTDDLDAAEAAAEKIIYFRRISLTGDQNRKTRDGDARGDDAASGVGFLQCKHAHQCRDDDARFAKRGDVAHRCALHRDENHPVGEDRCRAGECKAVPPHTQCGEHRRSTADDASMCRGEECAGNERRERVEVSAGVA